MISAMKRLLPLLLLAVSATAAAPAFATWVPTADSTTSAPKFTDGNFVIKWNTNNKQLSYVSHDSSVSTVCDMTALSTSRRKLSAFSPNILSAFPKRNLF